MIAARRTRLLAGLAAGLLAGCLAAGSARADDGNCAVPAYLIVTEAKLAKVGEAISTRKQLDVLVIGTGSSVLAGSDGPAASYPARMESALKAQLPGVAVTVTTALQPKKTAAEMLDGLVPSIEKLGADRKPTLTIWQTGTVDAVRTNDPDEFRNSLDSGIAVLQKTGTDVLMMNLQYSPRTETMVAATPYIDTMRVVSQDKDVPLFDRFSIMRYWSEAGDFDLFNATHGFAMAKKVHDCIGRSLATMIIEAAGIKPANPGITR